MFPRQPTRKQLDAREAEEARSKGSRWEGEDRLVAAGDLSTVDGVLDYLGVQQASRERQSEAVNALYTRGPSGLRPLLDNLLTQFQARGLMFTEDE